MTKKVIIALLVVLVVTGIFLVCTRKSGSATVASGSLERYPSFESQNVGARDVTVWLPDGYTAGEPCDVLYMHDGQMLFDSTVTWNGQEWEADEVMSRLISAGKTRRCIIVGVDNTWDRLDEYFPDKSLQYANGGKPRVGEKAKGDAYLRFMVNELKPFIDERYKPLTTREHTFMMGSSMGGLISLYALCEYPDIYGGVACLSSHLSMEKLDVDIDTDLAAEGFIKYLDNNLPVSDNSLVYMDHGTEDLDAAYAPWQERVDSVFAQHGWDNEHYRSLVFKGHEHKERFWAKRLDTPLLFLLGTE